MKKVLVLSTIILLLLVLAAACGGSDGNGSIDGTWVPAEGQIGGFASITFDGNRISIPPATLMGDTPGTGISITYRISDGELIVTQSGAGVTAELFRLSFSRDGDTLTIEGVEYVRQN
jgi:hypothetical protein